MANIIVRLPEDLHDLARIAAAARRRSLNAWIGDAIRAQVLRQGHRDKLGPVAAALNQLAAKS